MSEWIVYSKDGKTERCRLKALEYSGTWMNERAVTATFEFHSEVAFEVFDYIVYRGEVFELEAVPTVKKTSSFNYSYELRFVSKKYELERCEMRDLVPDDNGVVYPTPLTFSFTGDVRYLVERIQACLDALYGEGVWNIVVADGVTSEEKNITIAQQNCWNALALVNTTYGLNFYVKGRTVTIGGTQPSVAHTFEYGKGNGLYEIERAADTETGIVTKLRAYGGTRNLDYSYPKKPEWEDSALPVSFAFSPLRLMLPSFKTDGKTDFVIADDATIAKYGVREASMVYDDIYPTITGATNSSGQAIDEIKAVDAVDDTKSTFTVYLHDLGFDLEEHLTSSEAQLSMKSGTLQGYTFNISTIQKLSDGYRLVLGRNSLEGSEESGFYVPNADWNMKAGDKFVLLNILMPQTYIREAERRLLARAQEYLAQYGKTNFGYNVGLHDKFLVENPSVYDALLEGTKLRVRDTEIGIDETVTIQSITITENMEENILPQVKVTLNNQPSASTLDRIQGKLNDIANETTANNFSSQSELMAQYRKKLDKPFFDKLFVAIDAGGNEIASNDVVTPVAYIKARYDMVVAGGVTMYVDDNRLDLPSIYAGLPIDGQTLYWDNGVLKAKGGTEGAITDITSSMVVSALGYTPAKASDLTALQSTVNDFLSGSDTDSIINKWKELETFLSGLTESDNLATILGTKANKATTLAGYGIMDAYTKSDVNTLLGNYVTLATAQTITGEKNFTGGLKVNGSPIVYDATNKYWKLEGDLLVTGGVTMYGNDSEFVPSTIMDAIAVDGTTISKANGYLEVIGGTGSIEGLATVATTGLYSDLIGTPTLVSSFTNDKGYIDQNGLYNSNIPILPNEYDISVPGAGAMNYSSISDFDNYKSIIGSFYANHLSTWYIGMSIRHRNGYGDGNKYGMYLLASNMTSNSSSDLVWNAERNGEWKGERVILDSKNWSQYVTTSGSGNYISYRYGSININTVYDLSYTAVQGGSNSPSAAQYGSLLTMSYRQPSGNSIPDYAVQIFIPNGDDSNPNMYFRTSLYTAWNAWRTVLDSVNYSSYALSIYGGTMKGKLYLPSDICMVKNSSSSSHAYISYSTDSKYLGDIGFMNDGIIATYYASTNSWYKIWHSGNFNPANYLPIAGGTISGGNLIVNSRIECTNAAPGLSLYRTNGTPYIRYYYNNTIVGELGVDSNMRLVLWRTNYDWCVVPVCDQSGNLLVTGGITMYSDIRKKTKLQDVELSLSQIANAPLIEHYYNSDDKRTTHVGSIAQYWAGLNDWFCKKDQEGFYTMEIQNAALASAISVARHLQKYETKTDRKIRMLKKRISELEDKIEQLEKEKTV